MSISTCKCLPQRSHCSLVTLGNHFRFQPHCPHSCNRETYGNGDRAVVVLRSLGQYNYYMRYIISNAIWIIVLRSDHRSDECFQRPNNWGEHAGLRVEGGWLQWAWTPPLKSKIKRKKKLKHLLYTDNIEKKWKNKKTKNKMHQIVIFQPNNNVDHVRI